MFCCIQTYKILLRAKHLSVCMSVGAPVRMYIWTHAFAIRVNVYTYLRPCACVCLHVSMNHCVDWLSNENEHCCLHEHGNDERNDDDNDYEHGVIIYMWCGCIFFSISISTRASSMPATVGRPPGQCSSSCSCSIIIFASAVRATNRNKANTFNRSWSCTHPVCDATCSRRPNPCSSPWRRWAAAMGPALRRAWHADSSWHSHRRCSDRIHLASRRAPGAGQLPVPAPSALSDSASVSSAPSADIQSVCVCVCVLCKEQTVNAAQQRTCLQLLALAVSRIIVLRVASGFLARRRAAHFLTCAAASKLATLE